MLSLISTFTNLVTLFNDYSEVVKHTGKLRYR